MKLSPTNEQSKVMSACESLVKVKAAAGSGKTSTISLFSQENTSPSIYLAFNKSIANEVQGKLGSHVKAQTTHSLAYRAFGGKIRNKLSRPRGGYVNVAGTPSELVRHYKLLPIMFRNEDLISSVAFGLLIKRSVDIFQASSDEVISEKHVDKQFHKPLKALALDQLEYSALADSITSKVLNFAKQLWEERSDPHSKVLANHDTYLKMYQLSKPKLNYDIIYLDEAQDTTDCVLDIVMSQKNNAKIVMVGDDFQAIYGWRGAINAMSKVHSNEYQLTKSFRFGNEIAKVASSIINHQLNIKGNENINSEVGTDVVDCDKQYTKIYRTNGALLEDAIWLTGLNHKVSAEVDTRDFIKLLESSLALFQEDLKKVKHDTILPYNSWQELLEESKHSLELKRLVKIVHNNLVWTYINALKKLQKRDGADIILTTAHKSKGREWDQVILADDFPVKADDNYPQEEVNLLYVAATRAILKLNINEAVLALTEETKDEIW